MHLILEELEEFDGEEIQGFNIDEDKEAEKKLEKLDPVGECGGVPFIYDEASELGVCGQLEYHEFKEILRKYRDKS